MQTDKKIQVIMSTYNGEKYLKEQIESILAQDSYDNIQVLIRDDGSTDGTKMILDEYQGKYNFQVIKGNNIGVNRSLFELFSCCDMSCDYFAISDQDDVWIDNKISLAVKELEQYDSSIPLLFASPSCITDEKLNSLRVTKMPKKGPSFYNAMVQNIISGHTQVFNKQLLKELKRFTSDEIVVIDWWIYLVASAIGKVKISDEFTVFHRQHKNNAIGYETSTLNAVVKRVKRLFFVDADVLSIQLETFLQGYEPVLNLKYKKEIENFFVFQKNIFTRIHFMIKSKTYRLNQKETFFFKVLYVLGRYKIG